MTLWTFGDSFAQPFDHPKQWLNQVATTLRHEHKAFGYSGSALEYTYRKFYEIRNDIHDNDIIVISLTDLHRKWFFKHEPNIWKTYLNEDCKELAQAMDSYRLHLNSNVDVAHTNLYNFLYVVNDISEYTRTVIVANFYTEYELLNKWAAEFNNLHIAKGVLFEVSLSEFSRTVKKKEGFENFLAGDSRANHLTRSNHTVLANKIIDCVNYNKTVDLTQGFVSSTIDEAILEDSHFVNNELFGVAWWELNKFLRR
jgi:hypothetical protein